MKNFILLLITIAIYCAPISSFAQIEEGEQSFKKGSFNSFYVTLSNIDQETVEEEWMKFMKNYKSKGKKNKDTNEMFSDNAEIRGMSNNSIDVTAVAHQVEGNVVLKVWFDLGGAYLNTQEHPDNVPFATKMLERFTKIIVLISEEKELERQKNIKNDMKKETDKLKNEISNIKSDIEKLKAKLTEKETELDTTTLILEQKTEKLNAQKEVVRAIKAKIEELKN